MTTRGPQFLKETFIGFLQSQMWPFERTDLKTGEKQKLFVQGVLRPIELWEYIVPEQCLDDVMNNLTEVREDGTISNGDWNSKKGQLMLKFLRVALGAKKLPKIKKMPVSRIPPQIFTHFGPSIIGWKKDDTKDFHFEEGSFKQEGI